VLVAATWRLLQGRWQALRSQRALDRE